MYCFKQPLHGAKFNVCLFVLAFQLYKSGDYQVRRFPSQEISYYKFSISTHNLLIVVNASYITNTVDEC